MDPKKLWDTFGSKCRVDRKKFYAAARSIESGKPDLGLFPQTDAWVKGCYHRPSRLEIQMSCWDELIDGYGVEFLSSEDTKNGYPMRYVNMGDPYATTIVSCGGWVHQFRIGCWGDYVKGA